MEIENKYYKKLLYILLIVSGLFFFVNFVFQDILIVARHGILFWDTLFQGKILSFYQLSDSVVTSGEYHFATGPAFYDFPIYMVFALWLFPCWIFEKVTKLNALAYPVCIMWIKLLPMTATCLCIRISEQILTMRNSGYKRTPYLTVLLLTSPVLVFTILIMCQYDAIGLVLILLGLKAYLQDDRRQFLLWFALATPFKLFNLFFFVPLLLLREKRVLKIIESMICVMIPYILFKGIFVLSSKLIPVEIAKASETVARDSTLNANQGGLFAYLIMNKIQIGTLKVPVFLLVTILFYVLCYALSNREEIIQKYAIFMCFMAFSIFMMCAKSHPQWSMLLLPLMFLIIAESKYYSMYLVVASIMIGAGKVIADIVIFPFVYSTKILTPMMSGVFHQSTNDTNLKEFILQMGLGDNLVYELGQTMFAAGILLFGIFAFLETKDKKLVISTPKIDQVVLLASPLFNIAIYGLLYVLFYMN